MSCKVSMREVAGVAVIDVSGRLTLGEGSGMLRDSIRQALNRGHRKIVVNVADVTYIDSAGLGELVGSYATVTNLGGQLKLLNAQHRVHDLLQITKLFTVFEPLTDEAEAIRSFKP